LQSSDIDAIGAWFAANGRHTIDKCVINMNAQCLDIACLRRASFRFTVGQAGEQVRISGNNVTPGDLTAGVAGKNFDRCPIASGRVVARDINGFGRAVRRGGETRKPPVFRGETSTLAS